LLAQFGLEASTAVTAVIAFVIIFVLLTLFSLVMRRIFGRRTLASQGGRTRQPRLGIVDVYDLDRQRQLILLRRDNVEHLLLIGGPNDVVIETNIVRVPGAARPQATPEFPERLEERPPEAVPARPVVEALPLRATNEGGERRGAVAALPAEAATAGASMQPNPARGEAVLKPDVVALQGGRAAPRRPEAPPPPSAQPPRPEAPRRSAPIPPALSEAPPPKPAPTPIPSPIPEPQGPDAVILSDMARQLEEALKRPAAPVKPPEPASSPPPPATPPQVPVRAETPPRPSAPPPTRPSAPPPARPPASPPAAGPPRPAQADPAPKPPSPPPQPQPAPQPAQLAPNGPAAEAAVKPPRPEPAAKPEARPEPPPEAPPRVSDPFSVEEIEAEFARLLGRPFDKNDKGDKA
jgi:hypothetical protein